MPRLPGSRDHVGWLDLNQPIRGQHPPSLTNERAESWILRVTHINGPGPGSQVQGQVISPRVAPAPALRPASHSAPGAAQTLTEYSDQIQDSNRINSNLLLTIDTLKC